MEPAYWGHHAWIGAWSRHAFELAQSSICEQVYFLLLTSTHRSYRFLPGFFQQYYPRPNVPLPTRWREHRDALARLKFPTEFDSASGLVRLEHPTPVRPERIDTALATDSLDADKLDADTQFFLAANPSYQRGDFLVCITDYALSNIVTVHAGGGSAQG